ncbi:hypothetical protein [Candidatus Nitrososphaera sp. FF02]|jgi:hypothetical protein
MSDISNHFEKAKARLQSERDSMAQNVKEQVSQSKRKVLSKA